MSIELPKDAEGREIPLDTKVLYNEDGKCFDVDRFTYSVVQTIPSYKWGVVFMDCTYELCHFFYLTPPEPPDSWEKLEEDLSEAGDARYYEACAYFHRDKDEDGCISCPGCEDDDCDRIAMRDILDRIRNLRGEE